MKKLLAGFLITLPFTILFIVFCFMGGIKFTLLSFGISLVIVMFTLACVVSAQSITEKD